MATLTQLRTRVDAWLADKWPTFVARQDNYFVNKGTYWQGLITHSVVPVHTSGADGDSVPDRLIVHPTDVFEDWKAVFPEWEGVNIPAAIKVDVYDGPQGKGWCATIYIRYNGTVYTRSRNVGPEFERTEAWRALDAEEVSALSGA